MSTQDQGSSPKIWGHVAVSTACLLWAASFIATKTALDDTGPFMVVGLRHIVASLCFLCWLGLRKQRGRKAFPRITLKFFGILFILSLLAVSLHHGAQTVGLQYTTAANASVYAATAPIAIFLIAFVFLNERFSLRKMLGVGLALFGVCVVIGFDTLAEFDLTGQLYGDLLVFASILSWAFFTVFSKKIIHRISSIDLIALVTFIGTVSLLPFSWWEMNSKNLSFGQISWTGWLAILFLGVTCSFLANLLYLVALRRIESQKIGIYLYTIPPMTAFMAVWYLNEHITPGLVTGTALVFAGLYFTQKG